MSPISSALVQEDGMGRMQPEMRSAHDELVRRGVPVRTFLRKHLERGRVPVARDTIVVGEIPTVELALKRLGIEPPPDPSYPEPLRPFLLRRVWSSTLRDVRAALEEGGDPRFVKPRDRLKRFTGRVVGLGGELSALHAISASAEVWCAEVVRFVAEHRVFVIDGSIVGARPYAGDPTIDVDREVVRRAVEIWSASSASAAAYGIDFGVLDDGRTALVELNDGYGLGSYGLDDATYVDLLLRRWAQLVAT